jgi:hypothetical protein
METKRSDLDELREFIARMKALGHHELVEHAQRLLVILRDRISEPLDHYGYVSIIEALAQIVLAVGRVIDKDDLVLPASLLGSIAVEVAQQLHANTEVDGLALIRALGKTLLSTADKIETEAESVH